MGGRNYNERGEDERRKGKLGEPEVVGVRGSGTVAAGLDKEYNFDAWNGDAAQR